MDKIKIFENDTRGYYRAKELPDVRDGLTLTQRILLKTIKEMSCDKEAHSAAVIRSFDGNMDYSDEMDGWYDQIETIYDHIATLSQPWRTPRLLEGRGNFGHISNLFTCCAAPRFTGTKLTSYSKDIFKITRKKAPLTANDIFKAFVPNAIVSGTFGTACNIPSHNLGEVLDAVIALIQNPEMPEERIFDYIKGPDFATGGVIINKSELPEMYKNGVGNIIFRANQRIECNNSKKECIISELPFSLIQNARDAHMFFGYSETALKYIMDGFEIFDKFSSGEVELYNITLKDRVMLIPLKATVDDEEFLKCLFTVTNLEGNYEYRSILLSNGKPKLMSLYKILTEWISFYREFTTKSNKGVPLSDDELCEKLMSIKKKYATPRKTKIIDAE